MKKTLFIVFFFLFVAAQAFPFLLGGAATNATVAGGGFSPLSYSPELWLSPNDAAARTASSLLDKSGNGNHFAGASAGLSFVAGPNGTTVASYDGSGYGYLASSGYAGPALTNFEIWFVVKRVSESVGNSAYARLFTFAGKFSIGYHIDPGYGGLQIVMNSGSDFKGAVTLDLTNYHLYRAAYNAGTWLVYQDGALKTVTDVGDYAPLSGVSSRIGGGEYDSAWVGNHGDILIFPRNLNGTEASTLTEYLSAIYL